MTHTHSYHTELIRNEKERLTPSSTGLVQFVITKSVKQMCFLTCQIWSCIVSETQGANFLFPQSGGASVSLY